MINMEPLRRPKRTCGALSALEATTFTAGVTGVVVLEQLSDQLLLSSFVIVLLLALVRGVPVPRLRLLGGSVSA
jgi:hypothetical protein